jgi:hypothetical protein
MELKPSRNQKGKKQKQIKVFKKRNKLTKVNPGKKTLVKQKGKKLQAKKNDKRTKNANAAEIQPVEKKVKTDPTNIYPDSLSIFNDLQPYSLYTRHYYTIRYIVKPTIFSASVTIFYTTPWITLLLMLTGFIVDFTLGMKNTVFKKKLNNTSIMVENGIFILVSIMFGIFVANGESKAIGKNLTYGYIIIGLIAAAFISLIVFKVKGKKAL